MQPHEIQPDTKLCTILGYNAQTGYTRKFEGTGLGLALVKKYAELNNAEMTLRCLTSHNQRLIV